MPRKASPTKAPAEQAWYLREWMAALGVTQAILNHRTDWGKARTNDIYHGRTGFYEQILLEAAAALNLRPYELLLPPEEAMAIRQLTSALRVVDRSKFLQRPEPESGTGTHG